MPLPQNLELLTHYVIARTDPSRLGATKLNKVLWFADIEYYRRHGQSLTGLDAYKRMPRGPVPIGIGQALSSLKSENKIIERERPVYSYTRREFVWVVQPNIKALTSEQVDLVNQVIDAVCEHTADGVSEATHDALWHELTDGELMPVAAGAIIPRAPTGKELDWAKSVSISL